MLNIGTKTIDLKPDFKHIKMIGKILGGIIGFRIAGVAGMLVGTLVGHFAVDENMAKKSAKNRQEKNTTKPSFNRDEIENAYQALGLKPDATIRQVKAAYHKKCKELHPDLLQNKGLGESALNALEAELRRVSDAYQKILQLKNAKD